MLKKPKCPVIAIEEHYWDSELASYYQRIERNPEVVKRMTDFEDLRLKEMDEAGVDVQVLSHGAPSLQNVEANVAVEIGRRVNDRLAAVVAKHPTRFAAFGALPTADPEGSADELSRCVETLGFKGAMIHGTANGLFLDDKRFWPIFARAEKLDVPIYLHPSVPLQPVMDAYYKDYVKDFPMVIRAAWGFTVETATQAIRMVLSGVFDAHPNLKIIIGHLGETLPFLLWRIDQSLSRPGGSRKLSFRDTFSKHFYVTTSGNFSNPALLCCVQEIGIDRIMFAIDWPFVANPLGTEWVETIPLCEEDKIKLLYGNSKRILKL
jgi:2,3-dihydroxybenzoate decarboxylase